MEIADAFRLGQRRTRLEYDILLLERNIDEGIADDDILGVQRAAAQLDLLCEEEYHPLLERFEQDVDLSDSFACKTAALAGELLTWKAVSLGIHYAKHLPYAFRTLENQ